MSGFWQRQKLRKLKEIRLSLNQQTKKVDSSMTSEQQNSEKEDWKLYDTPEKLSVRLFFEIMKTRNLELLKESQNQKVPLKVLSDIWMDLEEYYYSETGNKSWKSFKSNLSEILELENQITGAKASFVKLNLALDRLSITDTSNAAEYDKVKDIIESAYADLEYFEVESKDVKLISSEIKAKETHLNILRKKEEDKAKKRNKSNKSESFNYHKLIAQVNVKLSYQIDVDNTSLAQWIGIIIVAEEMAKAEAGVKTKKGKKR